MRHNKIALLMLWMHLLLIGGCTPRGSVGGNGTYSTVTTTEAEFRQGGLPGMDSLDHVSDLERWPYLGTWEFDETVDLRLSGIPLGNKHIQGTLTVSEGGHVLCQFEDLHGVDYTLFLGIYADMKQWPSFDASQSSASERKIALYGVSWTELGNPFEYRVRIDIGEGEPDDYQVKFQSRNQEMLFYYENSDGQFQSIFYRQP